MDMYLSERGSLTSFYVNLTDLNGLSVNADGFVTLRIEDVSGSTLVGARNMENIRVGYYVLDWSVPFDFPISRTNKVVATATVDGATVTVNYGLTVVESEGEVQMSGGEVRFASSSALDDILGAIFYRLKAAQQIPVYGEQARLTAKTGAARVTFGHWNQSTAPVVRRNTNEVDSTLYTLDYNGRVYFADGLSKHDRVNVDYNFSWFERAELAEFAGLALQEMNVTAPGTGWDFTSMPSLWTYAVVNGAVAYALRRLIFDLAFQEPRMVYDTPKNEGSRFAMEAFKGLLEDAKTTFEDQKIKVKRSRWPTPGLIVTPEYTLPGGRSRWFRYLFK
jgi:hypothetical protein